MPTSYVLLQIYLQWIEVHCILLMHEGIGFHANKLCIVTDLFTMDRGTYPNLIVVTEQNAVDSHSCPKSRRSLDFSSPKIPSPTPLADPVELRLLDVRQ